MKFTIVDSATGNPFIQQNFDTEDLAKVRLDELKKKFGDRYALAIAPVGGGEVKAPEKPKAGPPAPDADKPKSQPRR